MHNVYILLYMRRPILRILRSTMVCCVKRSYFLSFCLQSEMKNKEENHHGGFQQQSPQLLVNKYEYRSSQNDDK